MADNTLSIDISHLSGNAAILSPPVALRRHGTSRRQRSLLQAQVQLGSKTIASCCVAIAILVSLVNLTFL